MDLTCMRQAMADCGVHQDVREMTLTASGGKNPLGGRRPHCGEREPLISEDR